MALFLLAALAGCKRDASESAAVEDGNLTLMLPAFQEYLDRDPPRKCRLTIDGSDFTEPRSKNKKVVKVDPQPGKDSIHIEFQFWPVAYSKTIRQRTVKLKPGETLTVDLTKEDPQTPDRFEAIYFQTAEPLLDAMMQLAGVKETDTVMDIGCGDGRLVITAVKKYKAKKGIGIDIRKELVELSQENAVKEGVADRTEFLEQDALKLKDISHVSVVFLYLGENLSARLQPLLQKTLKPGSRVVSLDFPIGDWKPDEKKPIKARNNYGRMQDFTLLLWQVR
jgi:SAM-dependent methyltransferase